MFDRVRLKENAKKILKKNYWWAVLVALIFSIVAGGGAGTSTSGLNSSSGSSMTNTVLSDDSADDYDDIFDDDYDNYDEDDDYVDDIINGTYGKDNFSKSDVKNDIQAFSHQFQNLFKQYKGVFIGAGVVILIIFFAILIALLLLSIFIFAPLQVGCCKWFVENRKGDATMNNVAHVFSHGYMNVVLTMFLMNLFTFLWTLLFIIPGIIKGYEYRMIPYILAENPDMEYKEAFRISKELMNGNKWNAFVLDLSFLGWNILSVFTCGLLGIFYVNPYIQITNAELYVALCQGIDKYKTTTDQFLSDDNSSVEVNPY